MMLGAPGAARRRPHRGGTEARPSSHVINTCCITSEAEAKSRQSVRRSLRDQAGSVFVSGCAANLNARQFAEIDAAGDGRWPARPTTSRARWRPGSAPAPTSSTTSSRATAPPAPAAGERTRGFVKVQDGCDGECAYCIIPTVRGGARSRPAAAVLARGPAPGAAGQPEMVMTGISVGDYRDPERGLELGELMAEVAQVPGVERVRLSSVEVIHVRDSLIAALASEPKVCPHLHIPMQSGDDGVLRGDGSPLRRRRVRRDGSAALRAAVPQVNVTTDVIVGFPTEDEAAFERTLDADRRGRDQARAHVLLLAPPGNGRRRARRPRPAGREEAALAGCCAGARRSARASTGRPSSAGRERVLIDKLADARCSGYTADYTRCYLPAGAGRARRAGRRRLRRAARRRDPLRNRRLTRRGRLACADAGRRPASYP